KLNDVLIDNIRIANEFPVPLKLPHASYIRHNSAVICIVGFWDKLYEANISIEMIELYFKVNPNIQFNLTAFMIGMFRHDPESALEHFKGLQLQYPEFIMKFLTTLLDRAQEKTYSEI